MGTIFNKQRIAGIVCLIVLASLMISPTAYAATDGGIDANAGTQSAAGELKLTQSYPVDNDTKLQMENTGIKLFFNGNVIDKSVWKNNKTKFSLTTKKGKVIKTKAYASRPSGTDYILVVTDSNEQLKSNSEYVFTVKAGVKSTDGDVLSEDIVLNYKTIDQEGNTKINMGLMAVMVVGMIVMTTISTKRQEQKKTQEKEDKVNPYKIAKEKGKSVEEVTAQLEKEKARKAKRARKKDSEDETPPEDENDSEKYRVKGPRPISASGSTYKTGRKALAEKKANEEAARKAKGTTNPKKNGGKKKGKKKK